MWWKKYVGKAFITHFHPIPCLIWLRIPESCNISFRHVLELNSIQHLKAFVLQAGTALTDLSSVQIHGTTQLYVLSKQYRRSCCSSVEITFSARSRYKQGELSTCLHLVVYEVFPCGGGVHGAGQNRFSHQVARVTASRRGSCFVILGPEAPIRECLMKVWFCEICKFYECVNSINPLYTTVEDIVMDAFNNILAILKYRINQI